MDDTPSEFADRLIEADVATWDYDPVADRLHADAAFARLLGLSEEAASGGPLLRVFASVHPQDRERMADAFAAVLRTKRTFAAQFRVIDAGGRTRTVVGRAQAELGPDGRVVRLPGILIDVSTQREAERRAAGALSDAAAADARFRAFFEHNATFAAITDPQGVVVEANEGSWRGGGYARTDIVGAALADGPWWRDSAACRARVHAAVARAGVGATVRERIEWRRADGFVRHLALVLRPVEDAAGRIVNLAASGFDVTEQVIMERLLRDSATRYRIALDAAEMGTWSVTPEHELSIDERFARIFAGQSVPFGFARAAAIVHPDDHERIRAAIDRTMSAPGPTAYDEEYRVVHPGSGEVRWVQARGRSSVEHVAGRPRLVSFDGTVVDTTARRRMEDELRKLAEDLAEEDRRKDEFLATLAHELRNPLAPISNALHLLAHDLQDRDGRSSSARPERRRADEALATLERQVVQMTRLVNDLMDVSRISRGHLDLDRRRVSLARIVEAAVEASRPVLDAGRHELAVVLPEAHVELDADVVRLSQALVNLLNNAAKYSERGSPVKLVAARDGDEVHIDVVDEGIGIEPARVADVFRMFVQVDASRARAQGGLGIGLALVKRFVTLHGGRVEVRSAGLDRGSTFRVTLPIARSDVAADPDPRDAPTRTDASRAEPSPAAPATPRRVLVVDDNEDGARTWVTVLGLRGYRARAVHDGFSAIAAFADARPDIVLLDIGMPGIDGHETCRRLRALPGGQGVHILALTGWGAVADLERSAAAGFDRHLVKPVKAGELLALFDALPAVRTAPADPSAL